MNGIRIVKQIDKYKYVLNIDVSFMDNGKKIRKIKRFTGTFVQAQIEKENLLAELKRQHNIAAKEHLNIHTFQELFDLYTEYLINTKKTEYIRTYQLRINRILQFFEPNALIESLAPEKLNEFRIWYKTTSTRSRSRSPELTDAAVNRAMSIIRAALIFAVKNKKTQKDGKGIDRSPIDEYPWEDEYSVEPITIEPEQFDALLEHSIDYNHKAIYQLLLYTGIRLGRILHLKWNQINFEKGIITVPKKDPKRNGLFLRLPLTDTVKQILIDLKKNRSVISDYVFPSPNDPSKPINSIRTSFERSKKLAGLPKEFTLHCFRHTFVTSLLEQGIDPITIISLTGHKTLQMLNRYSHLSMKHLKKEASKMESEYSNVYDFKGKIGQAF